MKKQTATAPLSGIRVLDLTRVLAGPFCTMILADLGAEVIKVEIPKTGDDSRAFGPFKDGHSLYYTSINHGKKSVSINLKSDKGKELLKKLILHCDVLAENFRPGTMERMGLGYDVLKKINPKLVYAATSGYGHSGPDSLKPGYDILAQARGGVMSVTGWPEAPPTRVGVSFGDLTGGVYTVVGVLAALYQAKETGIGQKVDISLLDCQVAFLENALSRFQVDQKPPRPIGNRHPTISPFQAFKGSDRPFVIAIGNDSLWQKLCSTLGCTHLLDEECYKSNKSRTECVQKLDAELSRIFATKSADHWIELLEGAGIPVAPINDMSHVMTDKQVLARHMVLEMDDPKLPGIRVAGNPVKMSGMPEKEKAGRAPDIGEHNIEVFTEILGLPESEVDALKAQGVLG